MADIDFEWLKVMRAVLNWFQDITIKVTKIDPIYHGIILWRTEKCIILTIISKVKCQYVSAIIY